MKREFIYGNLFQTNSPANEGYAEKVGNKAKNKKLNLLYPLRLLRTPSQTLLFILRNPFYRIPI